MGFYPCPSCGQFNCFPSCPTQQPTFLGKRVAPEALPELLARHESNSAVPLPADKVALPIELPADLAKRAGDYVANGWAPSLDALVATALDRYLRSHSEGLAEKFARQDVEWGLSGKP